MKNQTLDELTEMVKDAMQELPTLYMHGNGEFIAGESLQAVAPAEILAAMHRAKEKLGEVHLVLAAEPRALLAEARER